MTQPNIIWLTLDSVRGDRTSMAGYERATTPNMSRIAEADSGTAFTNCISHGIWSLPSDASLLSGTYPAEHGTGLWNNVLPEDFQTVPERFRELGYHTAALSQNAYFSDATDLSRGFDEFEWLHKSTFHKTAGLRLLGKYLAQLRTHSAGYTAPLDHQRPEYLTTELLKKRVKSFAGSQEPFFMFAHTQGAHLPYVPPLPHQDDFTGDIELSTAEAVEVAYDRSVNYYREIASGCDFDPEVKTAIDAMYDGLLAYVDERVGSVFDYVQSLDLGPTIFVVTGDHGDMLGERGVIGHQFLLDDALVNVPLVVHGLDSLTELPDDSLVQHLDLMRILLKSAGATDIELDGMHGIDIRETPREFALTQRGGETYDEAVEQISKHDASFEADRFQSGFVHAVRDSQFKLLRTEQGETLHELPDEETDVRDVYPDVADEHSAFLDEQIKLFGRGKKSTGKQEMTDAMKNQLSDLGYIVE